MTILVLSRLTDWHSLKTTRRHGQQVLTQRIIDWLFGFFLSLWYWHHILYSDDDPEVRLMYACPKLERGIVNKHVPLTMRYISLIRSRSRRIYIVWLARAYYTMYFFPNSIVCMHRTYTRWSWVRSETKLYRSPEYIFETNGKRKQG